MLDQIDEGRLLFVCILPDLCICCDRPKSGKRLSVVCYELDDFPSLNNRLIEDIFTPLEVIHDIFDLNAGLIAANILQEIIYGVGWADETEDMFEFVDNE